MNQFDTVKIKKPSKNVFNLSHDNKMTLKPDLLYPVLAKPIYPGDTFNVRAECFLRTMPLFAPVMHNVDMFFYFFFVPNRLLWNENRKSDWKTFITGGEKGDFASFDENGVPVAPHFTYAALEIEHSGDLNIIDEGSLLDYMGFPTNNSGGAAVDGVSGDYPWTHKPLSSLPFRAYTLVWNEYFRNQNLQDEVEFSYDGGAETAANIRKLFVLRKKNFEKDYFTSALPFQQRGQAVSLPIIGNPTLGPASGTTGLDHLDVVVNEANKSLDAGGFDNTRLYAHTSGGSQVFAALDDNSVQYPNETLINLYGKTSKNVFQISQLLEIKGLSIGTISDLRTCMQLQVWLENNARCGSRYIEQLLAHFGVVSSDARLQRPELLGGGKIPLIFTDVPQTSQDSETSVQGNLAGKGQLFGKTSGFRKYFEEHGVLLGLCCILPRTSYCDGIPREWMAMDKTDYYFPEFAHLSEQAVTMAEVCYPVSAAMGDNNPDYDPDAVFGYQGRFLELRYYPSTFHGDLRSSLQYWHLGRIFENPPALNSDFVEAKTRMNVFSVYDLQDTSYDPFVCQIHLDIKAVRPLPKYAIPSIV